MARSREATIELAKGVMAHAEAHYEDGGWDVMVECMTIEDIADEIDKHGPRVRSVSGAIRSVHFMVDVWADRQADARNSAF